MYLGPAVALDVNGDVWLSWSRMREAVHKWTHSYVSATSSPPVLAPDPMGVRVSWNLSEVAPGSWWSVLRDPGSGSFESISRVRADQTVELNWVDHDVPTTGPNSIRYRIRRESTDSRYVWLSPVTVLGTVKVPASGNGRTLRLRAGPNPVRTLAMLELDVPESGPLDLMVQDAGGRCVARLQRVANGATLTVPLDLSGKAPGVYFITAIDARGRRSPTLKLVHLQ